MGYACGWGEYKDSKQYKQVWKTIDGGTTWTELDLSGLDGYFNAKSSFMADIHFISETEGAVSNGTNIYVTKNGGATWTVAQVTSNIWNGEAVEFFPTQFCYADSTTLYSVGNTQVFKSVDGGLTWNIVKGGGPLYTAVDFRDANYGIAVTDESNLLWLTMDGGATWSTHTAPYLLVWSAVKFINDSTVYAAGFSDGMVKSTDGGFTWVEDNYPVTDGGIKNFYVTETGVVFASGSQGFVKRKVPGMNADFEYSKDGLSVSFTNRSMGFITTYKWEVDGVEKSTLKNPEIIFETGGTYQVKLTV